MVAWDGGLWAYVVVVHGSRDIWICTQDERCGCEQLLTVAEKNNGAWIGFYVAEWTTVGWLLWEVAKKMVLLVAAHIGLHI